MAAKKKWARLPTHGWQVVVPVYERETLTNFDHEASPPVVYLDKGRAERARERAERLFLSDVFPHLDEHVEDWFVDDEGQTADEALATFFAQPTRLQHAFVRAFLPGLWKSQGRSWLTTSDEVVREAFYKATFAGPVRATPGAWDVARRIVSPYLPMPSLRKVGIVP